MVVVNYAIKSHRLIAAITTMLLITVSIGILIVPIEQHDFKTEFRGIEDGLWWAFTTATGVGYGDLVPTTTLGRIFAVFLEIVGVANFGLIIALITIALLRREQQFYWNRTTERFDRIEDKLNKLQQKQDYSIKKIIPKQQSSNQYR